MMGLIPTHPPSCDMHHDRGAFRPKLPAKRHTKCRAIFSGKLETINALCRGSSGKSGDLVCFRKPSRSVGIGVKIDLPGTSDLYRWRIDCGAFGNDFGCHFIKFSRPSIIDFDAITRFISCREPSEPIVGMLCQSVVGSYIAVF